MKTDLEIQLALAKELPELIDIHKFNYGAKTIFRFKDRTSPRITSREWDWIVKECEKKLHRVDHWKFVTELMFLFDWTISCNDSLEEYDNAFVLLQATWQQRATAYFKTIRKEE